MNERRNFYGRLKGKALKPSQQRYLDEDLPGLAAMRAGALAPPPSPLWLEIGFGSGEHLVHQAKLQTDVTFMGAEPYVNGVASLLGKLRREGVRNVRVHHGDARDLMDVLPDGAVEKAFLLYPDPWPKTRHHRRRFVTPDHLGPLHRVMAEGGELRIASDIGSYIHQALIEVPRAGFAWTARQAADWREPWEDWTRTRYEAKAVREGRVPTYLTFVRT